MVQEHCLWYCRQDKRGSLSGFKNRTENPSCPALKQHINFFHQFLILFLKQQLLVVLVIAFAFIILKKMYAVVVGVQLCDKGDNLLAASEGCLQKVEGALQIKPCRASCILEFLSLSSKMFFDDSEGRSAVLNKLVF